ncbi:hypothetical protein [Xanthovirga aplysinae]|uniref:hypothetical protein n=1 Tax=Xanthovirga aplysinae TaxID=2529853 RepID=UPI0012BB6B92|nr:hypothetical protein [Xanthovirga aplysinae]MTI32814.1 hypothetical protein [Xanthovirga aplysinae]
MSRELELEGAKELSKAFDALEHKTTYRILRRAIRFAATPTKKAMYQKAHVSDRLADSVAVVNSQKDKGAIFIGPRKGSGYFGYLGPFFEQGGKERFTKDGKSTGVMPRYVFAEPSIDNTIDQDTQRFSQRLGVVLDRELEKLRR